MTPRRLIEPARLASTTVLRGQSDERLIDLTRAGNERAFEAIVQRYRRPLLRYCSRILPPGRAEDAVQQAFLSAYKAIAEGDRDLKLKPWLYRIAHNSALNLLRQNGWNHEQLDEQFDGVLRPDQAVESSERVRSLVASVKRLPERQRDAIVLRELEGRSYEEIAVALGVTDGAVRQLLNRARTTLRAGATALTPYGLAERLAALGGGAGDAASLAKVGTAVLVAGAVATGTAVNHGVPVLGDAGHHRAAHAAGGTSQSSRSTPGASGAGARPAALAGRRDDGRRRRGHESTRSDDRRHGGRSGNDGSSGEQLVDDRSGSGGPGPSSTSGTSGDDGHSGSGSSGSGSSGSGSSGSGDGSTTTTTTTTSSDNSGPGSGSTSGTSGSDGSGSSSSGPGDGGMVTTTTTTTSSGSGDGSSGSGGSTSISGGPH